MLVFLLPYALGFWDSHIPTFWLLLQVILFPCSNLLASAIDFAGTDSLAGRTWICASFSHATSRSLRAGFAVTAQLWLVAAGHLSSCFGEAKLDVFRLMTQHVCIYTYVNTCMYIYVYKESCMCHILRCFYMYIHIYVWSPPYDTHTP